MMSLNEALDVLDKRFAYVDYIEGPNGALIIGGDVVLNGAEEIADVGAALLVLAALKREQGAATI